MEFMLVTMPVSQLPIGWLKEWTPKNMLAISVTFAVFHFSSDWLKRNALLNIDSMSVTLLVSQLPSGWLKFAQSQNMKDIFVT